MSHSGSGRGIARMIEAAHTVYNAAGSLERFVAAAGQLLIESEISPAQVCSFVYDQWDPCSCLPHLVDTDTPPFLIDLHTSEDWCLRVTVWPTQDETEWRDVPHNHFGFIATTSITDVAYRYDCIPHLNKSTTLLQRNRSARATFI